MQVLEEALDPDYEPSDKEIADYAEWLGMDLDRDQDLFWIARAGLCAPIPKPWRPCQADDGELFYFNFETGESVWDHPCDEYYRKLYQEEKAKVPGRVLTCHVREVDDDGTLTIDCINLAGDTVATLHQGSRERVKDLRKVLAKEVGDDESVLMDDSGEFLNPKWKLSTLKDVLAGAARRQRRGKKEGLRRVRTKSPSPEVSASTALVPPLGRGEKCHPFLPSPDPLLAVHLPSPAEDTKLAKCGQSLFGKPSQQHIHFSNPSSPSDKGTPSSQSRLGAGRLKEALRVAAEVENSLPEARGKDDSHSDSSALFETEEEGSLVWRGKAQVAPCTFLRKVPPREAIPTDPFEAGGSQSPQAEKHSPSAGCKDTLNAFVDAVTSLGVHSEFAVFEHELDELMRNESIAPPTVQSTEIQSSPLQKPVEAEIRRDLQIAGMDVDAMIARCSDPCKGDNVAALEDIACRILAVEASMSRLRRDLCLGAAIGAATAIGVVSMLFQGAGRK